MAGIALRRLLIASLCDQLSNANGFVRKIVLEHAEPAAADSAHTRRRGGATGLNVGQTSDNDCRRRPPDTRR